MRLMQPKEQIAVPGMVTVLQTDLAEPEQWILTRAEEAAAQMEAPFAGEKSCVFFRLPYVPPYEDFRELRRLILSVRSAAGLRDRFRGIVALDVTEWKGCYEQPYFTVTLKYLSDHPNWYACLVLRGEEPEPLSRICARYMTPRIVTELCFGDGEQLARQMDALLELRGRKLIPTAGKLLAQRLQSQGLAHYRSLGLLERVADELARESVITVSRRQVREYLSRSFLNLLDGERKENDRVVYEKQI